MDARAAPNLFDYATSELSQDAVLCWLLAWADGAHAERNPALHDVASHFVQALADEAKLSLPPPPWNVVVDRQVHAIDVVAWIGKTHAIVIEDKVHTHEHSDQLARYREAMARHYSDRQAAFVYLKTGEQGSYAQVEQAGWTVFRRRQLLDLLRSADDHITNAIFLDFRAHLEAIENAFNAFSTTEPSRWDHAQWRGFYAAMQQRLGQGSWSYVPNQSGGFMAFYWGYWTIDDGCELYLQLEQDRLVVKIWVDDADRRTDLRNLWSERVLTALPDSGLRRPTHFGHGTTMTVAVDPDYLALDPHGFVDLDVTAKRLDTVTASVRQLAHHASPPPPPPMISP